MSLLDLPTEVLQHVISDTMPLGFESLLLTCKTVYEAGKTFLRRHNDLRRRYRHFSYHGDLRCSLQLLHRIAKDPLIASYIEMADFRQYARTFSERAAGVDDESSLLDDDSAADAIKHLLGRSLHLKAASIDASGWFDKIANEFRAGGNSHHASIFVFSLLPNLRDLTIPQLWAEFPSTYFARKEDCDSYELLEVLVQNANQNQGGPLSKLAVTRLSMQPGYEERAELQVLAPFLALPSLRHLSATSCVAVRDGYTGTPFAWPFSEIYSNVEEIELAHSCVSGTELSNLLVRTPKLRSFKLGYETKWHGCGHDWDVSSVISSLAHHCGSTLKELSITIDRLFGDLKGGICSLRDFSELQDLELDIRFFFGPPATGELRELEPNEYCAYPDSKAWTHASIPALVDILPPTLRSLRLISQHKEPEEITALKSLFHDFEVCKGVELPLLDKVVVSSCKADAGDA